MKQFDALRPVLSWKKIFGFFTILVAGFSCTIISDDDIDTIAEVNALKLTEIEVVQASASGTQTISAKFLYDSAINVVDGLGNTITRKIAFSMPAFTSESLLQYRSGITTAPTFYQSYLGDGKPYLSRLMVGDSIVETYRFQYDDAGRIIRIVTAIDPIGEPESDRTNDSLFYLNTQINALSRWRAGEKVADFKSFLYNTWGSSIYFGGANSVATQQGAQIQINSDQGTGSCGNNANGELCRVYTKFEGNGGNGGGSASAVQINVDQIVGHIITIKLSRITSNGRKQDTYYFHPLMFLRNQIPKGRILFPFYLYDWFSPGELTNGGSNDQNQNDAVTFNFKYEH